MTPLEISIAIHYWCFATPYKEGSENWSELEAEIVTNMIGQHMLKYQGGQLSGNTPAMRCLMEAIQAVPWAGQDKPVSCERHHVLGNNCHRCEIERLRALLRQWQFDVGGASERLERKTLAAINAVPQAAYDLGFARGSGDEGAYQREIAQLRSNLSLAEEGLANYAQENQALRDVLQDLCDHQNGPPLEKYREKWQKAYDRALELLRHQPQSAPHAALPDAK